LPSVNHEEKILSPHDPHPVEKINMTGCSSILLSCEHAGQLIPASLGDLGLPAEEMNRHIAYDIGAASLSRLLSKRLDAPLFMQRYSRLVVDCNRPFSSPTLIPPVSDGSPIPANQAITSSQRQQRFYEIHQVFHNEVQNFIVKQQQSSRPLVLVAMHSFTRQLRTKGERRDLSLGLLFNRDRRLSEALMAQITCEFPDIKVAFNEPYSISDDGDYTIPVHGEGRGIPHVLIEIVNDEIDDEAGQRRWCDILEKILPQAAQTTLASIGK